MHPRLFSIGPFTVYSYGLMLGVAFIVANVLLVKELKRKGIDPNYGSTITLLAMVFGVAGSKLLYLLENLDAFLISPMHMTFSPAGLTWYGGLIVATLAIWVYSRRKRIPFLALCDAASPGLMIAYGIGRIGCHLAGDGDYGVPTNLPWAMEYSGGTFPPSVAFKDFPEIVSRYGVNGVVPDTILVHPAPLYEFVMAALLFAVLWKLRTRLAGNGRLFMIYLMLTGAARFLVEFVRVNPRLALGLSEAQIISAALVLVALIGWKFLSPGRPGGRAPGYSL
jgi:phosphatidylglycerol:prolipoprotein diacylglycerol transferase